MAVFQSTLPRRERPQDVELTADDLKDFKPRSRGGSDPAIQVKMHIRTVFQSTLPRRERLYSSSSSTISSAFQSTLPRRERLKARHSVISDKLISIHAPAEGATMSVCLNGHFYGYFNPRSRGGSDKMIIVNIPYDFYFNPRSRGGSDGQGTKHCLLQQHISIHAPAEGATCHDYNKGPLRFSISIHAPAEGATSCFTNASAFFFSISIHAPAEGATKNMESSFAGSNISIHAPAEGATLPLSELL